MLDKDAIKARLRAATPGPWREGRYVGVVVCETRTFRYESLEDEARDVEYYGGYPICESALSKDRDLIARAPTDIADLLAEVERLETELAKFNECPRPGRFERCTSRHYHKREG